MAQQYSIAEARDRLPGIVHQVEDGAPVELTRRGTPVAVIVSVDEYRRMASGRSGYWTAYQRWRSSVDPADLEGDDPFADVRDRSPGREVDVS
jgi:prevent-host-death family protein